MSTVPPSDPNRQTHTTHVVLQQPTAFGRYGKLLLVLLALAVMVIIGQSASYQSYFSPPNAPQEKFYSLNEEATDKIAIIRVEGPILDAEGFVKKQIDRVREDDAVKAVVLRIDSPGGTVTASDFLYNELRDMIAEREIPMVVSMGSICASGGYYMAMAAESGEDVIFAEPTTWTGSIGVVIPHYDISGLLANWKIEDDSIASHKYKLMGSPTRQLSPEEEAKERELLQELVDESFERFKQIVLRGRPALKDDEKALETATTGRIFTSDQALELKLIDKQGFLEAAIDRAAELAGREPDSLRCVHYEEPPSSLEMLLGAKTSVLPAGKTDLASLLDLAAPRAYYICTWLPAILTNSR
ncbi:MAG TPA: signal peptide peptidase SppA [Lacipirellula sp.]